VLPIDDSDMGCDCKTKCEIRAPWTRQTAAIEIAEADAVNAETLFAQMAPMHRGEKAQRPGLATGYAEPRDEREAKLAALWEELFGIAPVGVEDSFLELGGHSLLAIQMVTQIRSLFDADLPVTALFEEPTIAGLSKLIGRAKGEESEDDLAALLALVEGLSPEEAERKLAEMGAVL
jgi:acyl carrier protein